MSRSLASIVAGLVLVLSRAPERKGPEQTMQPANVQLPVAALQVGQPVPDIELSDLQGKRVRLSDFLGKRLAIFSWASW